MSSTTPETASKKAGKGLTDTAVRKAKAGDKPYKMTDSGGLYLLVAVSGGKLWRYNYRHGGKRLTLSLGVYPDVSLARARERHQEARTMLAEGQDPGAERQAQKTADAQAARSTLAAVAEEWLSGPHAAKVTEGTAAATAKLVRSNLLPTLGDRPIDSVTPKDLLAVLRAVEERGAGYSAHKLLQLAGQVWKYGVATARVERDITPDLRGALKTYKVSHYSAVTDPAKLGVLLRTIDTYTGSPVTIAALRLGLLTFVRPGELRHARWDDFDLVAGTWSYIASKTGTPHIVPLSTKALAILSQLRLLTGSGPMLFPGVRAHDRPMSENTINAALRYMGFEADAVTGHGFRATARTLLDEVLGFPAHLIEHQLAHTVRDPLGRAYNRTQHLPERRAMMQRWSDYLDELKAGGKVLDFKAA